MHFAILLKYFPLQSYDHGKITKKQLKKNRVKNYHQEGFDSKIKRATVKAVIQPVVILLVKGLAVVRGLKM